VAAPGARREARAGPRAAGRAHRRVDPVQVRRVAAGGTTTAVRAWRGRGTPLLAWHALGVAGSGAFVDVMAERLSAHGLRPYALDAPGFAESPALPAEAYAVDRLSGLLLDLIATLGLERPLLLGHSWGAAVVLEAARRDPGNVSGVVLLDAGHANYSDWPSARPEATVEQLTEAARADDEIAASWEDLEQELEAAYPGQQALLEFFRAGTRTASDGRVLAGAPAEVRGAALHGLVRARPSEAWPVLQEAGVPCLLLLATVPEYTDRTNRHFVTAFEQAWPDAEVVHLEGATHTLFTEVGAELGDLIGDWASRRGIASRDAVP
jgi:pimeloyl-ACP methyl ester carboxylesterase